MLLAILTSRQQASTLGCQATRIPCLPSQQFNTSPLPALTTHTTHACMHACLPAPAPRAGVYTLHDLRVIGRKRQWCPYFLARHMIAFSNVVVYNYQYMIDPKVQCGTVRYSAAQRGTARFSTVDLCSSVWAVPCGPGVLCCPGLPWAALG